MLLINVEISGVLSASSKWKSHGYRTYSMEVCISFIWEGHVYNVR